MLGFGFGFAGWVLRRVWGLDRGRSGVRGAGMKVGIGGWRLRRRGGA